VFFPFKEPMRVKTNCWLFETLYKIKKASLFMFFFVLEILIFLYYANEESDDDIDCSTKAVNH